ncbi:hypothetical protein E1301_Tti020880 [Triplophysa tibetana]|uniref:Uncharacterized protein n=1 Tax=Triplophysa tibetana TaxID=1572043 RepID=A0A5A9NQS1_9TELE|nr:hypothetical protein E1301_Tti020880 [Triplophysa tibetana]
MYLLIWRIPIKVNITQALHTYERTCEVNTQVSGHFKQLIIAAAPNYRLLLVQKGLQNIFLHAIPDSTQPLKSPDQRLIVITAVAVSVFSVICIIILIFMYRRAKAVSGKSSESQNHLTEENRSISSSRTSEDEESSKCLNEKQQHWIEAGSV